MRLHDSEAPPRIRRATTLVILVAIAARFGITFLVHASGDSLGHLSVARYIAQTQALPLFEPVYRPFFYYPPFFHVVAAGLYAAFAAFGESAATKAMDFAAPLFGGATLIVSYLLIRSLVPARTTLWAMIFLGFVPLHVYYSTLGHVDIAASLLAVSSVCMLHYRRLGGGAIVNGFGLLTKYSHVFIFPTLLLILKRASPAGRSWVLSTLAFFSVGILIGAPLYVRNMIRLGTPIWPFLSSTFASLGLEPLLPAHMEPAALSNLADPWLLVRAYLDIFGVPLGLPSNLLLVPLPLVLVWLTGTLLYSVPVIAVFFAVRATGVAGLVWTWIVSYLAMCVVYVYDFGDLFMRLLLPAFPALAVVWAIGFERLRQELPPGLPRALAVGALGCLSAGFLGAEFAKTHMAAERQERYAPDFAWIRQNVPDDAYFDFHSLFLVYHTNKRVVGELGDPSSVDPDALYHFHYPGAKRTAPVGTEPPNRSSWHVVYENPTTGVRVLKKTPAREAARDGG